MLSFFLFTMAQPELLQSEELNITDMSVVKRTTEDGSTFTSPILGAKFVLIPAGMFIMGADSTHQVTISRPFYLQTTEVTQGQWKRIMGNNPSYFKDCGDDCPVEKVSWNDAQEFISKLNQMEGTDKYRLPTEAEWEYAARSGGKSETWAGTSDDLYLGDFAWYTANSEGKTHPVGRKNPNGLGLYDMTGNVWEWVQDWYGSYPSDHVIDPTGPSSGSHRVTRGGSWSRAAKNSRTATRGDVAPGSRGNVQGFRLLRTK